MKIILYVVAAVILSIGVYSCSSGLIRPETGETITVWRTATGYDKLEVARAMKVVVKYGQTDSIKLEVSEGFLEYIKTEVVGGTLRVYIDESVDISNLRANDVTITVQELTRISCTGASSVEGTDTLYTEDLTIVATGASSIEAFFGANKMNVTFSGASFGTLGGAVDRIDVDITESSHLLAFGLDSREAFAVLSGSSSFQITCSELLDVKASGASIVLYRGNPGVRSELTGGSEVKDDN